MELAKNLDIAAMKGKKLYVDVGSDDEYGLQVGIKRFVDALQARGVSVQHKLIMNAPHHLSVVSERISIMLSTILM